jgi:tetratricopeptide (TPR) repeat protein
MHFTSLLRKAIALVLLLPIAAAAADWERAVALYNKGEYKAALAEFQDVALAKPDTAGAWYYIGLCEFKLQRFNRVETPISRAIDLLQVQSPASSDLEGAYYALGFSMYLAGNYEKAAEVLKLYSDLARKSGRPIDSSARRALGRASYFLERYDDALTLLAESAAAKDQPKESASDFYYIGAIHVKRESDDRAIPALREAVKLNPEEPAAIELLAESLMRRAQKAGSTADWTEAAELGQKLVAARDDLRSASVSGRAHLGAKRFEKAVPPLEKLARANREDAQAWLYYGVALSRSGQLRKAMEALEIAIQIAPSSLPALLELGFVYETDKQYQQARRVYEKADQVSGSSDPSIKQSIERVRLLALQQR